jgi:hypothetical protein
VWCGHITFLAVCEMSMNPPQPGDLLYPKFDTLTLPNWSTSAAPRNATSIAPPWYLSSPHGPHTGARALSTACFDGGESLWGCWLDGRHWDSDEKGCESDD